MIITLLVAALGVGCQEAEEAKPTSSPPLGAVRDPKLVGTWELKSGGKSTMTLNENGESRIISEANSPGGVVKADVAGTWSAEKGILLMRRKDPAGVDFTAEYRYSLNASARELKLSRGGRTSQTYLRSDKGIASR